MFFFKHITTKCSSCIYKSEQPDYLGRKAVDRNISTGRYTTVALRSDRNTATPHTLWIYVNFNANLIEYIYIYQLYSPLFPPPKKTIVIHSVENTDRYENRTIQSSTVYQSLDPFSNLSKNHELHEIIMIVPEFNSRIGRLGYFCYLTHYSTLPNFNLNFHLL